MASSECVRDEKTPKACQSVAVERRVYISTVRKDVPARNTAKAVDQRSPKGFFIV